MVVDCRNPLSHYQLNISERKQNAGFTVILFLSSTSLKVSNINRDKATSRYFPSKYTNYSKKCARHLPDACLPEYEDSTLFVARYISVKIV